MSDWPDPAARIAACHRAIALAAEALRRDAHEFVSRLVLDNEATAEFAEATGTSDALLAGIADVKGRKIPVRLVEDTHHLDGTKRGI